MALEKCKECGEKISSSAKQCPSCGHPIKRTSIITKIVLGFIVFGVIVSIIGNWAGEHSKQEAAQDETARIAAMSPEQKTAYEKQKADAAAKEAARDKEIGAAAACKVFIQKNLKDPDSAEFLYAASEAPVTKNSKGIYEVQHKVRAKNNFGAYTLSYFNCDLKATSDSQNWQLVNIKEFQ